MIRIRLTRYFSILIPFLLFVTGCRKPITPKEIAGMWTPVSWDKDKIKDTNICQINFQPNGTVSGFFPDYLIKTVDRSSGKLLEGSGKWTLEPLTAPGTQLLHIDFTDVDGKTNHLRRGLHAGRYKGRYLILYFGTDTESGVSFTFHHASSNGDESIKN